MDKVFHVVLQLSHISDVTLDARLAVAPNVQGVGGIARSRKPLGHHVHAAATRRRAVHQYHATFARVARRRVISKGDLSAISRREVTDLRQIGEVHALEWVIDARHGRWLAWATEGDGQPNNRRQN